MTRRSVTESSIEAFDAAEWNALAGTDVPFLRHEFLHALERTGCVGAGTGSTPSYFALRDERGLAAAVPAFRKSHSFGEFVFDFAWAQAYARVGLPYYPKLVLAVPFTPATGTRLLVRPGVSQDAVRSELAASVEDHLAANKLSSAHALFIAPEDRDTLEPRGWLLRRDCQFHWRNRDYASFDAFLETFTADKRKKANRERRRIAEAGIEFRTLGGAEIEAELWDVIHGFSLNTFRRHGHDHYLTAAFFKRLAQVLPGMIMVKLASYRSRPVAAAIFFVGADTLYGRYWGAAADFDSLHFETCYYQGIEYCIERGLARFEPGTQGEHKVPRGFEPSPTFSAHWVADARFASAIAAHLRREDIAVDEYMAGIRDHLPFRRADGAPAEPGDPGPR